MKEKVFSDEFLSQMRAWLIARKDSKLAILKRGGEQALSHSPRDIVRIDFALRRMAEGQYGLCVQCGSIIERERLEFMPETPFCAKCARERRNVTAH